MEFFSAATSTTVSSRRSCSAVGVSLMTLAASASFCDAWNSPSAEMILARRSRSASACLAMDRFMPSGRATSLISTRSMWMPQSSAGLSSIISRPWLRRSRLDSRSSRSLLPMMERSEVCATWDTANR